MIRKIVGVHNDISVSDQIRFVLTTTDSEGCLKTPYKVNQVSIYFISRDFTQNYVNEYSNEIFSESARRQYDEAKKLVCSTPTQENINKLNQLKIKLDNSITKSPFFFKEAIPVKVFGGYSDGVLYPAWLNPGLVPPSESDRVREDNLLKPYKENNVEIEGKFILDWDALGQREGDYFICWTWQPNISGGDLSAHTMFGLIGDTKLTTSIPTHFTNPEKYQVLMDRYLPEMFKTMLSDSDLAPQVLQELNYSVAKGFTFLEDFANQMIDLLDGNVLQEQFLPLLSNIFNINLKSSDPALWRRQIKKAIPNYKQKGTIKGLKTALSDAGMRFLKMTRLWQVSSKYTFQECFTVDNYDYKFRLKKGVILPIDPANFELWIRSNGSENWQQLSSDYVEIDVDSEGYFMNWLGQSLSIAPIELDLGDEVKVLYQFRQIPNNNEQDLENYIRLLDLMDQRDIRRPQHPNKGWDQPLYPPKNWNIKLIEEDDPLFDVLIPVRHPIKDPIIWGKVRTEFPYSENIYNMEEYNGSKRDSLNPCDIDKEFVDNCTDCQGSKFAIDLEIEELSDDRILESQKVIEEFVPFHAVVHSINFLGSMNEFVKSPIEETAALITYSGEEVLISGEAQLIFNRSIPQVMPPGDLNSPNLTNPLSLVRRNVLSNMEDRTGTISGTGYNSSVVLFVPSFSEESDLNNFSFYNKFGFFDKKNINESIVGGPPLDNSNLLEILSPSPNAGLYTISKSSKKGLYKIAAGSVNESPLDESQFEFRISNKIYEQSSVDITQDNLYIFDSNKDLSGLGVVSKKDIDEDISSGPAWKIKIDETGYSQYSILEVLPNNKFILQGPILNLNVSNINWEILDSNLESKSSGSSGSLSYAYRAIVDLSPGIFGSQIDNVRNYAKIGDYVRYNNNQYKINSFIEGENFKFYIDNYNLASVGGVQIKIYRRIAENCIGKLGYDGLILETTANFESSLPIQNGKNALSVKTKSSEFKENYLIFIDSNYYSILDIDQTTITLDGPPKNWKTLGTSVDFVIYQFINQPLDLPGSLYPSVPSHSFDQIARSDNEVIYSTTESSMPMTMMPLAKKILNSKDSGSEILESTSQSEHIKFNIEYKDGNKEEGKI